MNTNNFQISSDKAPGSNTGRGQNDNPNNWIMWGNRPYAVRREPVVIVTISNDAVYLQQLSTIVSRLLNNLNTGCLISNDAVNKGLINQALSILNKANFQNTTNRTNLLAGFAQLNTLVDYIKNNGCTPDAIQKELNILVQLRTNLYEMYNNREPLGNPFGY